MLYNIYWFDMYLFFLEYNYLVVCIFKDVLNKYILFLSDTDCVNLPSFKYAVLIG